MKAFITPVSILVVSGSCLLASSAVPQIGRSELPARDLTLIANPDAFPPSPEAIAKIKTRMLQADQAAAVARIAAIEARIRQVREESEARIKTLSDERAALVAREKEISEALKTPRL